MTLSQPVLRRGCVLAQAGDGPKLKKMGKGKKLRVCLRSILLRPLGGVQPVTDEASDRNVAGLCEQGASWRLTKVI